MPRSPSPLPLALTDQPFSVASARDAGVTPDRLRVRHLIAPYRGVRSQTPLETLEERCRAYATIMQPGHCFSHQTAAALWGLPLPPRLESDHALHVLAVEPEFPPQADGIVGHAAQKSQPTGLVADLPVVAPQVAMLQLAARLRRRELVRIGDHLVRRTDPLLELDALSAFVHRARGVRGIVALRSALAEVREGTDSPMETDLRLALLDFGLPEPAIGYGIVTDSGDYVGRPDLAYVRERIAIEYEGAVHRERDQFEYDIRRREHMEAAGWAVIRVIASDLDSAAHQARLVRRIRRALHHSPSRDFSGRRVPVDPEKS